MSYGTLTHVRSLEGNYATTIPTVLVYSDMDGRNYYGFKHFWSKTFFQNNLISMLLLHHTGIELTSIVLRATMLPLPQRCSSIPIWKEEKSRLLNSFVTGISASFCQRYRFCLVQESNPCQELERLLNYHFINEACQLWRGKGKPRDWHFISIK